MQRPEIWGVLNVTPDSFSDGGLFLDAGAAVARAEVMLAEGADVIDVGGESTRPPGATYGAGAEPVGPEEELRRVLPVVERLAKAGIRVSVDTQKADVAERALGAGAAIINDVSMGQSEALLRAVASAGAGLVLMHSRGRGEVTAERTNYGNVATEVAAELGAAATRASAVGVQKQRIWLDPGFGFAKTAEQSGALLGGLEAVVALGFPVLAGASRKSFLAALAPNPDGTRPGAQHRLAASVAAAVVAAARGARAVRVHDVDFTRQALDLACKVMHLSQTGR